MACATSWVDLRAFWRRVEVTMGALTVGELIELLGEIAEEYGGDLAVYVYEDDVVTPAMECVVVEEMGVPAPVRVEIF